MPTTSSALPFHLLYFNCLLNLGPGLFSSSMLEVREVAGKGRGVFASRPIAGGETVLRELPLLLYPQQNTAAAFCNYCLRAFNSLGAC